MEALEGAYEKRSGGIRLSDAECYESKQNRSDLIWAVKFGMEICAQISEDRLENNIKFQPSRLQCIYVANHIRKLAEELT